MHYGPKESLEVTTLHILVRTEISALEVACILGSFVSAVPVNFCPHRPPPTPISKANTTLTAVLNISENSGLW
jgi:hypothetical protein